MPTLLDRHLDRNCSLDSTNGGEQTPCTCFEDQSESVSSKMLGLGTITVDIVDCTWLIMCSRFCVQRLRPRIFILPVTPKKKAVTAKNVPSIPCPYRRYREAKRDEADDKTSFARPALKNWAVGLRRKARSVPTKYGIRWSSHIL